MRSHRPRHRAAAIAALLLLALITIGAPSPAAAATIDWHGSLEDALAAAEQSGKPIFAFVYLGESPRQSSGQRQEISIRGDGVQARAQIDLELMLQETLADRDVVSAARSFEPLKLDLCDPGTDAARVRLKVGPGVDAGSETRVAMYPITLFLDPTGKELFRRHGCVPAVGYAAQLQQGYDLFLKRKAVLDDPQDARKRRDLGRAYMELDPTAGDRVYASAVEHLDAVIELDPENLTGANFDARVDLAILRIPEGPAEAVSALSALQGEDADGHRKLELQYYTAIAHFVTEDYASAKRLLRAFETNDRNSPYYDSPWTPQALGLLEYLKQIAP